MIPYGSFSFTIIWLTSFELVLVLYFKARTLNYLHELTNIINFKSRNIKKISEIQSLKRLLVCSFDISGQFLGTKTNNILEEILLAER